MVLHSQMRKGARVLVIFKDGTREIDVFVSGHNNYIRLAKLGDVRKKALRSLSYYRGTHARSK